MAQGTITRKLAAILYADVAGYSRLTGADEEGTHRTLDAYLDVFTASIKSHDGRVVHYAGGRTGAAHSGHVRGPI